MGDGRGSDIGMLCALAQHQGCCGGHDDQHRHQRGQADSGTWFFPRLRLAASLPQRNAPRRRGVRFRTFPRPHGPSGGPGQGNSPAPARRRRLPRIPAAVRKDRASPAACRSMKPCGVAGAAKASVSLRDRQAGVNGKSFGAGGRRRRCPARTAGLRIGRGLESVGSARAAADSLRGLQRGLCLGASWGGGSTGAAGLGAQLRQELVMVLFHRVQAIGHGLQGGVELLGGIVVPPAGRPCR